MRTSGKRKQKDKQTPDKSFGHNYAYQLYRKKKKRLALKYLQGMGNIAHLKKNQIPLLDMKTITATEDSVGDFTALDTVKREFEEIRKNY